MVEKTKTVVLIVALEAVCVEEIVGLVHDLEPVGVLRNRVRPMVSSGHHDREEWLSLRFEDITCGKKKVVIGDAPHIDRFCGV